MYIGNIHPIIVHFPVALLTVYSLLEIASVLSIAKRDYYFYLKAFCALSGLLSAIAAVLSGWYVMGGLPTDPYTVMHSLWGYQTVALFVIPAFLYGVGWYQRESRKKLAGLVNNLYVRLNHQKLLFIIALYGLLSVTVTGALGGLIAYGPDNDPFTQFLNQIFFSSVSVD